MTITVVIQGIADGIEVNHHRPSQMTVIVDVLGLADDGLPMMAGDVVELDAVLVEVVEDAQAPLVSLPVVRLGTSRSEIKGQSHHIVRALFRLEKELFAVVTFFDFFILLASVQNIFI